MDAKIDSNTSKFFFFSLSLVSCDLSAFPVLPVKRGTGIDYACKEMRGKMKEGEKVSLGANGASESRRCYLTLVQITSVQFLLHSQHR